MQSTRHFRIETQHKSLIFLTAAPLILLLLGLTAKAFPGDFLDDIAVIFCRVQKRATGPVIGAAEHRTASLGRYIAAH